MSTWLRNPPPSDLDLGGPENFDPFSYLAYDDMPAPVPEKEFTLPGNIVGQLSRSDAEKDIDASNVADFGPSDIIGTVRTFTLKDPLAPKIVPYKTSYEKEQAILDASIDMPLGNYLSNPLAFPEIQSGVIYISLPHCISRLNDGKVVLDYVDTPNRLLRLGHDLLKIWARDKQNGRYSLPNLDPEVALAKKMISGHIGLLSPKTNIPGYFAVATLETIESATMIIDALDQEIVNLLHANGILPLTSDAKILQPTIVQSSITSPQSLPAPLAPQTL